MTTSTNTWSLDNVKKMIGRQCGDPEATGYSSAIKDHLINAIESLAEDVVSIADINRALNDDERKRYSEVINISENEISPMLQIKNKNLTYINNVGKIAVSNAEFPSLIKIRNITTELSSTTKYTFKKVDSMAEFIKITKNVHLAPRSDEIIWTNNGNYVYIYLAAKSPPALMFYNLISPSYSSWSDTQDLQTLGFGTNFLTKAISRAAYTMRLQLGFEKE